jgi:cytochrome o ubiquinol oxidase operon protein cyoD
MEGDEHTDTRRIVRHYVIGFVLSLAITFGMYALATGDRFMGVGLVVLLGALALVQMLVQLVFFLHLGDELRPRYKLAALSFMSLILLIIVVGSLWIMHHLNDNMMDMMPGQKTDYMHEQRDKGF